MRYQAVLPLMVLAFRDNHHAALPLAVSEEFEVLGPDQDDRFIVIRTSSEEFLIFEADLRERAQLIAAKPPQAEPQHVFRDLSVGAR